MKLKDEVANLVSTALVLRCLWRERRSLRETNIRWGGKCYALTLASGNTLSSPFFFFFFLGGGVCPGFELQIELANHIFERVKKTFYTCFRDRYIAIILQNPVILLMGFQPPKFLSFIFVISRNKNKIELRSRRILWMDGLRARLRHRLKNRIGHFKTVRFIKKTRN